MNKVDLEGMMVFMLGTVKSQPIVYKVRESTINNSWHLVPYMTDEVYEKYKDSMHLEGGVVEKSDAESFISVAPLWLQVGDKIRIGGLNYEVIDIYVGHTRVRGGRKLGIMAEIDCDKYPEEATSEVELIDLAVEEIQEWDMSGSII